MTNSNKSGNRLLRLNIGYLLKEGVGYSREITFAEPGTFVAEDVTIRHLNGSLRLTRTPQGILVQGVLHAQTTVECVRCLDPVDFSYEIQLSELFTFSKASQAETDRSCIVEEGNFIDLTPIMREEGILAVPIQVLCKPDCKGLCSQCGQNFNEENCDCERDQIDPRMEPLRALLKEQDAG